jgi:L-ascorbate metabolism protein UlaG (beta-lactamase superfamily)
MIVRRLGWAGLEVELDGATLVVDLLRDASSLEPYVGAPRGPLPAPSRSGAAAALVTHLHADHADPAAIAEALAPDGVVLRPAPMPGDSLETIAVTGAEAGFAEVGLRTRAVEPWDTIEVGPFTIAAVPAVDGFGDTQVSWVVAGRGQRIFHGGDTLFHGSWWLIAMRHGPIDAAFLPVNGAVVDLPHRQPPSPLSADMDPAQAATAARLLGARIAVPIHYDTLHRPPVYTQVDDPAGAFAAAAAALGVPATILETGGTLEVAA